MVKKLLLACMVWVLGMSVAQASDPENTLYLDLKDGRVVIEMRPDLAPNHVTRIKELVRQGFYDGIVFHRVLEGIMAQTGDPTGTGVVVLAKTSMRNSVRLSIAAVLFPWHVPMIRTVPIASFSL